MPDAHLSLDKFIIINYTITGHTDGFDLFRYFVIILQEIPGQKERYYSLRGIVKNLAARN